MAGTPGERAIVLFRPDRLNVKLAALRPLVTFRKYPDKLFPGIPAAANVRPQLDRGKSCDKV